MRHTPTCNLQKLSCYQKKCTLYEGITVCAHLLASHVQSCPPQQFFPFILLVVSNKISVQHPQVFPCARIYTAACTYLCTHTGFTQVYKQNTQIPTDSLPWLSSRASTPGAITRNHEFVFTSEDVQDGGCTEPGAVVAERGPIRRL